MLTVKTMIRLHRLLDAYVIVSDAHKYSVTSCAWQRLITRHECVVHASEIHLCSLIGARTYARTNEYRRTMRSLNGAYIDHLLDNHVVISDLDARERLIMGHHIRRSAAHIKLDYFAQRTRR